jgi:hypothetical protein
MKKLTIQQFAQNIRKKRPGMYDDLSDNDLVFKWLKTYYGDSKYIETSELTKLGYNEAGKLVSKGKDYVKDKIKQTNPQDTTNDNSVVNTVKDVVDKFKNTDGTPKPTQTVDISVFNCIKNSGGNGKNLQQTIDNPNAYSFVDKTGEEFTFWGNGDFLYIGKNNRSQGKWKCKGSNNFEVITDWGGIKYYYRSETGQWALTPNAPALEENFIKKIVTKYLRSKL